MNHWLKIISAGLGLVFCAAVFPKALSAAANNPVPLINSVSPTAAQPGGVAFTLTVLGSNFSSSSVVDWNRSPRATTFVNATTLTAAITAADIAARGTAEIAVANPSPGGGVSNQFPFSVSAATSRVTFRTNAITGQLAITSNVVEGDFNNDGKLDIAYALGSTVFVLLGNGDGTFQSALSTPGVAGSTIEGLYVADVDSDGKLDLFATGASGSKNILLTFFGKGDGTFNVPIETDFAGSGVSYSGFVFADFNHDGQLDAAFAANRTQIVVLFGNSDGTFRVCVATGVDRAVILARRRLRDAEFL